jgi:hypothetical protein
MLDWIDFARLNAPRFGIHIHICSRFFSVFVSDPMKFFELRSESRATTERIKEAENKAEAVPEKARFAWDVARIKLEAYFDRNLSQVNQIFYFAVIVMIIGFSFVLWAVRLSVGQPKVTPISLVAAIAGTIPEFIGTTFMVVYRSTMAQANNFMSVLERINTVGMAVQVLDSMPDGEAKNAVRGQMTLRRKRRERCCGAQGNTFSSPITSLA